MITDHALFLSLSLPTSFSRVDESVKFTIKFTTNFSTHQIFIIYKNHLSHIQMLFPILIPYSICSRFLLLLLLSLFLLMACVGLVDFLGAWTRCYSHWDQFDADTSCWYASHLASYLSSEMCLSLIIVWSPTNHPVYISKGAKGYKK